MRKGLGILLVLLVLLLISSSVACGETAGIAISNWTDAYLIKSEYYNYDPWVIYADLFKYNGSQSSLTSVTAGIEYFLFRSKDHRGLYLGAGIPLYRDFSDRNLLNEELRSGWDSGYEYKVGLRFSVSYKYPWFDLEYSNLRSFSFGMGLAF